jgi:ADP-heptose:LPS heptosyltransferase
VRRLLIRSGALGDCILSFPALNHLKTDYTEVWIPTVVTPLVNFADRVQGLAATGINLVGVGDLPIPDALRKRLQCFDEIVSWYGSNRPEFREALFNSGVRCVFHEALPPADCNMHATDFFAQQVGAPLGLRPHIDLGPVPRRDAIVIHPFSGSTRKNWPLEQYRALAGRLPLQVEWTAGPEEELPEAVRFDDLLALAQWMGGARLYIGNDSGITHLAAAIGLPVIALFGPTDPACWAPRGDNVRVLRAERMEDIEVDRVFEAAIRQYGATK